MTDPAHCPHRPADVVLVEEGSCCTRCGLVAQVMPAPGLEYRRSVPTSDGARRHIADMRRMLAAKREASAS